jgi:hypothetical protein
MSVSGQTWNARFRLFHQLLWTNPEFPTPGGSLIPGERLIYKHSRGCVANMSVAKSPTALVMSGFDLLNWQSRRFMKWIPKRGQVSLSQLNSTL